MPHEHRQHAERKIRARLRRRAVRRRWRGDTRLRALVALAMSLAVVGGTLHLPLRSGGDFSAPGSRGSTVIDAASLLPPLPTRHEAPQASAPGVDDAGAPPAAHLPRPSQSRIPAGDAGTDDHSAEAGDGLREQSARAHRLPPVRATPTPVRMRPNRTLALPTKSPGRIHAEDPPRLYAIPLSYPEKARKARVEGMVIVRFVVDTDGRARGIELVERLHPECDAEALRAVRAARFHPARQNGHKVPVHRQLAIRFVLADG